MEPRPEPSQRLKRLEWGVCLGATLAALGLHTIYLTHAGGLWRDEANCVHMATFPAAGEMWRMLTHDSFPVLFPALLRFWTAIGLGVGDLGFRWLGFLIALLLLGVIWLNARELRSSLPLISVGLLAGNLTLVRWGDSMRGYGLGCCLILLTLTLVWALMRAPGWGRFVAAALAAVLSVQCLYQNAFLLLSLCVAGCFVCFRCRQDKAALSVVGVGAVAAVSLLPYMGPIVSSQRWRVVEKAGFHPALVWSNLSQALGSPMLWQVLVWIGLCLVLVVRGFNVPERRMRPKPITAEDLPLFAAITVAFTLVNFVIFLLMVKLPTQPWYWLPVMVVVAACIDTGLGNWFDRYRGWRLALVGVMAFVPLVSGIGLARYRQTNIDLIAAWLRPQAAQHDLIVVYPWYCGVTFHHYYHGTTPWTTLPALDDTWIQRYDLLKEKLAATAPIQSVLDRVERTLASGNRVWIVGELPEPDPGQTSPPSLPPAPDSEYGWADVPYSYVWGRQTRAFITTHGGHIEAVTNSFGAKVSIYERSSLAVAKGWSLLN